uniref:GDSL esterase/lipase n=1 Tax=Ananas comosus var. bracteatus TaxID=296719 RepID=A0A6V7QSA3_ANACO
MAKHDLSPPPAAAAATTSLSSSSHSPSTSAARRFSKIYAFGDSYTDTGNTHSADGPYSFGYVSSPPYGTTFFHRSTNRYSDGRLVVDFLTTALSLPFLPPYLAVARNPSGALHGVNFAVAGSTAIEHEFYVQNNITIDVTPQSLMTQLGWFQKHVEAAGRRQGWTKRCSGSGRSAPTTTPTALFPPYRRALFRILPSGMSSPSWRPCSTKGPSIL